MAENRVVVANMKKECDSHFGEGEGVRSNSEEMRILVGGFEGLTSNDGV